MNSFDNINISIKVKLFCVKNVFFLKKLLFKKKFFLKEKILKNCCFFKKKSVDLFLFEKNFFSERNYFFGKKILENKFLTSGAERLGT